MRKGFAVMNEDKQREIASKGGKAAHAKGTAHQWTPDEAREAGRKGGQSVSRDHEHMAEIGRKGGKSLSKDKKHMSDIGQKGAASRNGSVPGYVLDALAKVRESGVTNMLMRRNVIDMAEMFDERAARWLEANHTRYMEALNAMGARRAS